jgi:transcription elongation GreA/GreB family factor
VEEAKIASASPDANSGADPAMSRAFVNEDAVSEEVVDRPISPHPNYVTSAGLAQIQQSVDAAREAHGAAQISRDRAELAKATSELRYWSARRSSARVLTPDLNRDAVQFGSTVTIARDGRKQTFQIVGEDEAEPSKGKISYVSPVARAIINKKVGDSALLGQTEIVVMAISCDQSCPSDHAADRPN